MTEGNRVLSGRLGSWVRLVLATLARSAFVHWRLRRVCLRACGWQIGPGVVVSEGVRFTAGRIALCEDVWIGREVYFDDPGGVHVGQAARIGAFSRILTRTHPIESSVIRRIEGRDIERPVRIERGCWIGVGVTILPGVTIAEGCVIGAGSVVPRPTMPNGLYLGSPARRVRDLPLADPDTTRPPQRATPG